MGAITPGAFSLDAQPLDSPLYALDGVGDPLVISGTAMLVELQAYYIPFSTVTTLYFGTHGYSDPSGPGYYAPRMIQGLNFRREMFSGNATGGQTRASWGEMRVSNGDGGLDAIRIDYAFAGWPARLLIGDPSQAYGTFEVLLAGKPLGAYFTTSELSVSIRDRLVDFNQPVQINKYLGDNVLPNGLEGGTDLKDKLKPLLFGRVQNISPIMVNTSKLIYQVHDGAIEYLPVVYDKGLALTRGADYASSAEMMSVQPSPGYFRCWMGGGYFRLGASPAGSITCDAADKYLNTDLEIDVDNTAARVALRVAVRPMESGEGGITDADVNWDDVTLLDAVNHSAVGIWIADAMTFTAALDAVLASVGAWYGFDRLGKFRMQRHSVPIGVGVCSFKMFGISVDAGLGDFDITAVRFLPTSDPDKGVPTWEVSLDYGLNYTLQNNDAVAGGVSEERKDFLNKQYRTVKATQSSVKTAYPLAVTKEVKTLLIDQTAAQTEANRLLSLYDVQRDFVEIDTPMTSELIATVDIGTEVFLQLPRFNYADGRAMRIISMQYNPSGRGVTLGLWG